jgi:Chaperone of endosialidase
MRFVADPLVPSGVLVFLLAATGASAQAPSSAARTTIPLVIRVAGSLRLATAPAAPVEIATFAIYADETGGEPLWQETQSVTVNRDGQYMSLLGSTVPDGLPLDVFLSKAARWLGVKIERMGEQEQPRVLLASVPYALRASDADTLGGRPASAYVLAPTPTDPGGRESSAAVNEHRAATSDVVLAGTPNLLAKYVNGTDVGNSAVFEAGGAVGIGTTTPLDLLHLRFSNTNGGLTGYAVQNLGSTSASYSGMLFYDQNGALGQFQGFNNATHEYRVNNIASGGSINFMLGGASKFIVASNGKVGIGTTTPFSQLEVVDPSNTGLRVQTNTAGGAVGWFGGLGEFRIDAPNVASGRFVVKEDGRVGIGMPINVIPSFKLHLVDSSNTGLRVVTLSAGGTVASFGGLGDFQIDGPGIPAGRFVVKGSGATGIGTDTPGSQLDVNGIITVRQLGAAGATTLCRNAANEISTCSSSLRYKTNVRPFHAGLTLINRLRPIAFDWKANGEPDLGLAAEEVAAVEPLLVIHNDRGEVEGVKYDRINLLLINAIKEQQALITRQQEEIDSLRRRQDDLVAVKALICADHRTATVCKSY